MRKLIFAAVALLLLTAGFLFRERIARLVKDFFNTSTAPLNLAVFRIVVFFVLLQLMTANIPVWFSRIPSTFLVPPPGLGRVLTWLPVNEVWVSTASLLFFVVCLTGMIGLFSRTSALLACILGFYVLGVPHFYGKVSHYHHALWFVALLAVSPCGDMIACDAIFASWKRADRGETAPPAASRKYGLPLCLVWLLMGIVYFFPGLWKVMRGGARWVYSDNMKMLFYSQWSDVPGYVPFFRIDQYPLLYKIGAFGAICFELSFIFLIFLPRVRMPLAVMGIFFHRMNAIFMRITSFWSLEACYVTFFNWHNILHYLGRLVFPKEMFVVYDGNCKICRRTIASIRRFDVFGRIAYVNALDEKALADHGLDWLDRQAIVTDMHAVVERRTFTGFRAYRALSARVPIFWPLLPLMYLPPVPAIGNLIYRRVADSRTCSIARPPLPEAEMPRDNDRLRRLATLSVGGFLFAVNSYCGFREIHSWPFACYPTFASSSRTIPQKSYLIISMSNANGERVEINPVYEDETKGEGKRMFWIISNILKTSDESKRRAKFEEYWRWMLSGDPRLRDAVDVTFYVDTVWTVPERRANRLIERKVVYQTYGPRHL